MQDLRQALSEIEAIRGHMARAAEFHGYGPAALAATAGLAVAAAIVQPYVAANPLADPAAYAGLWSFAAALAAGLIGGEAMARTRRLHAGLADAMIRAALEQFLPAAMAGLLLTVVVLREARFAAPMLPGLWQILFGLGVFASARFLPRAILAVGVWYMLCGLGLIAHAGTAAAMGPWAMGAPFAVGQALAAAILWKQGRGVNDERP